MAGDPKVRLISPEDQQQMWELHDEGCSIREIAKTVGWSPAAVSRHLARMGADTDRSKTAEATAARVRKLREARIDLAVELFEDARSMRDRAWDEYTMVVTGPDGPETVTLDEPPIPDQAHGIKSIDTLINTVDRLIAGADSNGAEEAKNVITNIFQGLAKLVNGDMGLGERDSDSDYDISQDPDQLPDDERDDLDEDIPDDGEVDEE